MTQQTISIDSTIESIFEFEIANLNGPLLRNTKLEKVKYSDIISAIQKSKVKKNMNKVHEESSVRPLEIEANYQI